ncbi:nucleotidyltransferase family protein [Mycobacterium sp. UM_WGJ]|uniref:nucleotidyltransferase family protein n=1 Tax=Mycobacterium sp. UM_WGJ TaxID=1370120 RepID=UPI00046392A3|nr:nucleotidyltransferase domain-containing protein [Mycobacterium sp. UM_WGJ]
MIDLAGADHEALVRACRQCGVARLRVFGSAVTSEFDPETSDIDFLVDFAADAPKGIAPFLALQEELRRIFGRNVDLVEANAVRNPFFARRAFGEAVDVYAA